MKYFFIILIFYFTSSLKAQPPILPYPNLELNGVNPQWVHSTFDSTIVDNKLYDGYHHSIIWNRSLFPVEKDGYLYTINQTGIFDIEGGIIQKIDIETGELIWVNTYDRRTSNYNEQPFKAYINTNNQLEVVSYKMINSTDVTFPYLLLGGSVTFSIRRYDLETGALIQYIYPENNNYVFLSKNKNYFYTKDSEQYFHIRNIKTEAKIYYTTRTLNNQLNEISLDTIFLEIPETQGEALHGGFIDSTDGFISFDAKETLENEYYQINFWDKNLAITKTLFLDLQDVLTDNFPTNIYLDYVDDDYLYIRFRKLSNDQYVNQGVVLNHDGDVVRTIDYESPDDYSYYLILPFFNEELNCTYFCGLREENETRFTDIVEICDTPKLLSSFNVSPDNAILNLRTVLLLENKDLLIANNLTKDTLLLGEIDNRSYQQGVVHVLLDGEQTGLTNINKVNVDKSLKTRISPNPAHSTVHIVSESDFDRCEIYDIQGQLVQTFEFGSTSNKTIDLSNQLANGSYVLKTINSSSHQINSQKLLIQK